MADVETMREHLSQVSWTGFTGKAVLTLLASHENEVSLGVVRRPETGELVGSLLLASARIDHSRCGPTASFQPFAVRRSV